MGAILLPATIQQIDPANKIRNLALLTTITTVATIGGLIAGGMVSDRTRSRWGRRTPTIAISCGATVILMISMGLMHSLFALALLMPATWIAMSFYQASLTAMLPDRIPVEERGMASAAMAMGIPLGIFGGINLAAIMPSTITGYAALALLFIMTTLLLLLIAAEPPFLDSVGTKAEARSRGVPTGFLSSFANTNFSLTFGSRLLLFLAYFSVTGYLFYVVQDYIGISNLPGSSASYAVSMVMSLVSLGWLITAPLVGYVADRFGHTVLIVGLSSIGIGLSMMPPWLTASWMGMIIFAAVLGVSFGIYMAIDLKLMSMVLPVPEAAGRDLGILAVALSAPQLVTPIRAAGLIAWNGYSALFAAGALFAISGGLLAFLIKLEPERRRPVAESFAR
jgi:MFS family permease